MSPLNRWWSGSGRQLWLPNPISYVPSCGTGYVAPLTFAQRLHNSALYLANSVADWLLVRPVVLRGMCASPSFTLFSSK